MPVTKTAKRALRNSEKKKVRNLAVRRNFKAVVKKFFDSLRKDENYKADEEIKKVFSVVDRAVGKIIHRNKAARIKAQASLALTNQGKPAATKTASKKKKVAKATPKAKAKTKAKKKA